MWSELFPRIIQINFARPSALLPTICRATGNQAICLLVQMMKPERSWMLKSQINFFRISPAIETPVRVSPYRLLLFKSALFPKVISLWWKYSHPTCRRSATVAGSGYGLAHAGPSLPNRKNVSSLSAGYIWPEVSTFGPVSVAARTKWSFLYFSSIIGARQ